ncbi:hypothetical protein ACJMK2_008139 [Sinanodonta woodiana]|uniref:Transporter n=1 Tax=Sinanodonta woodiana TaxID=1069815 RepID=A0ABD3VLV7_SINWO
MPQRGNWKNWFEFLFSCIGCLVGLGNIWRFPYLCYRNGGGAFLIPYFFFMIVCSLPMFLLEMSYAQYSNLGPGRVWICCPLFKGVWYGMITLTGIVSIYYNVIIAWTLYYLIMSFNTILPWSTCDNYWNTPSCYLRSNVHVDVINSTTLNASSAIDFYTNESDGMDKGQYENQLLVSQSNLSNNMYSTVLGGNGSNITFMAHLQGKTSTEEFWDWKVLQLTPGIENIGIVRWELLICLFIAWLAVFLSLIKGIKSSGKVMYVAATVPYVLLFVLLIRGVTLPGAWDGFKYYIVPRWEALKSMTVWGDAAVQIFYSTGIGWGGIATLASYNNFHNNIQRYMKLLTSLLLCPGLAFVVYPDALSHLPIPQLWSVLFFLMLFTVGIDSQIVHVQTLTSAIQDSFPKHMMKRKMALTLVLCVSMFALGLVCVTQGGVYVLQILDWYCASVSVMFLSLVECLVMAWVYGARRLSNDIEMMIGKPIFPLWRIFWMFLTPLTMLLVWGFNLASLQPVTYGDTTYPPWAIGIGWIVALVSCIPLPVGILAQIKSVSGSFLQRMKRSIEPTAKWVPIKYQTNEVELDNIIHAFETEQMMPTTS